MATLVQFLVLVLTVNLVLSASIATESKTDDRAKRSGEVIFFENQQKGTDINKRSERWPLTNIQEDNYKKLEASKGNKDGELKSKLAKIDEKTVEAIEEEAFYALDFLVDKLVSQAYEDNDDSDDDIPASDSQFQTTKAEGGELLVTTALPLLSKTEAAAAEDDQEARQLALLLSKTQQKHEQEKGDNHEQEKGDSSQETKSKQTEKEKEKPAGRLAWAQLSADDSTDKKSNTANSDAQVDDKSEPEQTATLSKTSEDTQIDENKEFDDDSLTNIVNYIDYLKVLENVEEKLKQDLQSYKELKQEKSVAEKPSGENGKGIVKRRKRSVNSGLEVWSGGDGVEPRKQKGGVYFTAEEVIQLKDLLLELAKEKLESEDLLSYVLDAEKTLVNEDDARSQEAYNLRTAGTNGEQRYNNLDHLGYKMDRQAKRNLAYNYQWPFYRK